PKTAGHRWAPVFGGLLLASGAALLWRARRNSA
ncbi:LPXTG cell wall anchor domain-containing protein, partial [Streptomyces hyaluromycini]